MQEWMCEARTIITGATASSLTRLCIAKIVDAERLREVLASVPVRPEVPGWTCKAWVKEALETLKPLQEAGDVLGKAVLDWETVHDAAITYTKRKTEEGRFSRQGAWDLTTVATWDQLTNREIMP